MRIIETKVYKFEELSEEGKEKAVNNLSDINVDHEWWDFIYEDAEQICLRITAFDLDRASFVNAEFINSARLTALLILKNHGKNEDTYKSDYLSNIFQPRLLH